MPQPSAGPQMGPHADHPAQSTKAMLILHAERDQEKWNPVFRFDRAILIIQSEIEALVHPISLWRADVGGWGSSQPA